MLRLESSQHYRQIQKTSIILMASYTFHLIMCHKVCILSYKHIGVFEFEPVMAQQNTHCTTTLFLLMLCESKKYSEHHKKMPCELNAVPQLVK